MLFGKPPTRQFTAKNMNPVDIRIENLLPHRDRRLLIDEINEVDDEKAVTGATVIDQWPFFDDQAVDSLILIELVAQTAGVTNGWVRIKQRGKDSEKKLADRHQTIPFFC